MDVEKSKQLTKTMPNLYQEFHSNNQYEFSKGGITIYVTISTYLEEYYLNGISPNDCNSKIRSVDERLPLEETFADNIIAFRYFDRKEIEIEEERFITKKHNFSSMIYLGKRITPEELIEKSKNDPRLIPYISKINIETPESVIYYNNGAVITNPEDNSITLEELKKAYENSKTLRKH